MWRFSYRDVAMGATDTLKGPEHGRVQPISRGERQFTDMPGFLLLSLAWLGIAFTFSVPFIVGQPDDEKLTFGMDYKGDLCKGKFLYPIHRSTGVGVCVDECPSSEVDGSLDVVKSNPDHKELMYCMEAADFTEYIPSLDSSTNFETLTPGMAAKLGVCGYKYRSRALANRCYFIDEAVAEAFTYKVPDDFVVVFAQSFYSSSLMAVAFTVGGSIIIVSVVILALQAPQRVTEFFILYSGGHQAYKVVWGLIWLTTGGFMVLGSRMLFDSFKYEVYPLDPRPDTEIIALRSFGAVFWLLGTTWIFVMLRARHSITVAIMLLIESERALFDIGKKRMWALSCYSAWIATTGMTVATYGVVNIATMADGEKKTDAATEANGYRWGYGDNPLSLFCSLGILFFVFWSTMWLADLVALATSMSVCRWFFTRDKDHDGGGSRGRGGFLWLDYFTALRKHWGTCAIASLTHTFTDAPHGFLKNMERFAALQAAQGSTGASAALLDGKRAAAPDLASHSAAKGNKKSCRQCDALGATWGTSCLWIMDHVTLRAAEFFLKYTSCNAYASVAMFGTDYWASAKNSFFLIIRNKDRLGATMSVTQIIPFIAKVAATVMTTTVFYFIQVWGYPDYAISMVCSTLLCCITSWIITSQFLAPLTQAPSTLLQCYMLDEEYFSHDPGSRFAEKEMHTWVDTYGGEHATYTDMVL